MIEREIVGPKRLPRAESSRTLWCHTIPESVAIEDAFTVDYWRKCSEQLKGGDRVEVVSSDRRTLFEIFILESNPQASPARLDVVFRAIYPPDLQVPDPMVAPSRWRLKQRNQDGMWSVWDSEKDEITSDQLRKEEAQQQIALLENLAKENPNAGPPKAAAFRA